MDSGLSELPRLQAASRRWAKTNFRPAAIASALAPEGRESAASREGWLIRWSNSDCWSVTFTPNWEPRQPYLQLAALHLTSDKQSLSVSSLIGKRSKGVSLLFSAALSAARALFLVGRHF